jgi:hypothetical protein
MNIFGLCGFTFVYIPESIKYLLENGREKEAKKDIEYVLKFNKVSEAKYIEVVSKVDRLITKSELLRKREEMLSKGMPV